MRGGIIRRQEFLDALLNGALLHGVFVAERRSLVMNDSLAVDEHKLRDHKTVGHVKAHEGKSLILRDPADRECRLEILCEVADRQIRIRIDSNIEDLEPTATVFILKLGHYFRGGLAMRAGRVDKFQRYNFAAILAEELLTPPRNIEGKLGSFAR